MSEASSNITSMLHEERVFPPAKAFSEKAHIKSMAHYRKLYSESIRNPDGFWARQAKAELVWFKPWKQVLQWKPPFAKWFVGGQTNVSFNCLDKHLDTPVANRAAIIWEGEPASPSHPGALGNVQKRMEDIVLQRNPGDPYEAAPHIRAMLQAKLKAG